MGGSPLLYVTVVLVAFALGSMVQTVAGFGSALVAMPILMLVIGARTAVPVQVLLGFAVTIAVLFQNWHGLRWREAVILLAGSVLGIPLGAIALKSLPSEPITGCLGVVLIGYWVFALWIEPRLRTPGVEGAPKQGSRFVTWLVGLSAGILGGAYATDGPPLVIYGAVKRWPKATFKSVLQTCFLVNGVMMVLCHGAAGLFTKDVFVCALYGFPGTLIGMGIGAYLDRRLDHERFRIVVLWLVLILGLALLAQAVL